MIQGVQDFCWSGLGLGLGVLVKYPQQLCFMFSLHSTPFLMLVNTTHFKNCSGKIATWPEVHFSILIEIVTNPNNSHLESCFFCTSGSFTSWGIVSALSTVSQSQSCRCRPDWNKEAIPLFLLLGLGLGLSRVRVRGI